jgi:hypothetical protein
MKIPVDNIKRIRGDTGGQIDDATNEQLLRREQGCSQWDIHIMENINRNENNSMLFAIFHIILLIDPLLCACV